jgi:hypothetical protein
MCHTIATFVTVTNQTTYGSLVTAVTTIRQNGKYSSYAGTMPFYILQENYKLHSSQGCVTTYNFRTTE